MRWLMLALLVPACAAPGPVSRPTASVPTTAGSGTPAALEVRPDRIEASPRQLSADGTMPPYDIVFVIDRSESTQGSSGIDLDGDGRVGCPGFLVSLFRRDPCDPTTDTLLAVQLRAVRSALAELDARTMQVGVVAFSGDGDPKTPDAELLLELTRDYARVGGALNAIQAGGSAGRTNTQEAIATAVRELLRARGAVAPNAGAAAEGLVVLMTDGMATLPSEASMRRNLELAVDEATLAGRAGIRIYPYGIAVDATARTWLRTIARSSGGTFTAAQDPRTLRLRFSAPPAATPDP